MEILAQNYTQFLKLNVNPQPCVVDFKCPVNEGFDQSYFIAKGCKTKKMLTMPVKVFFAISGGDREVLGFVF